MHPFVAVMRRYVVDYLLCQNPDVCAQIMEPDYVLHMGGTDLGPRDSVYVPAVVRQLQQFPGLGMTVHEILVSTDDRLAMRFSQHGASVRHDGRAASWGGIGLYRWNGTRLTSNYAIEDYESRRRQLSTGVALPVEAPAIAPWDAVAEEPSPSAEAAVRAWLLDGAQPTAGIAYDDEPVGASVLLIDVESTVIDEIFTAGQRVAFHITQTGRYRGGLDLPESAVGAAATIYSVGVVSIDDGRLSGRVIRERGAVLRRLTKTAASSADR